MKKEQKKLFEQWLLGYFVTNCGESESVDFSDKYLLSQSMKKTKEVMKFLSDIEQL